MMVKLSETGRIFYGVSITGMGILMIYYHVFPYMLLPQQDFSFTGHVMLTFISGALMILVGVSIILKKTIRHQISFLFGCILLLIFFLDFIPYQFLMNPNYKQLLEWDNAGKELSLAGGAFVIAGCFSEKNKHRVHRFWGKLLPFGSVLFSIPIIMFGILHLLYAKDVSTLVPSWVPFAVFWTYLAGVGLAGSGIAIITKIKSRSIATLLGGMILTWFIILHIPRVAGASFSDTGGEVTSAFLALAYSGIAFVIAGSCE
jgi:uncharacterized membrane protein